MNNIKIRGRNFFDILKIKSHEDFHNYLFDESINILKNVDFKVIWDHEELSDTNTLDLINKNVLLYKVNTKKPKYLLLISVDL